MSRWSACPASVRLSKDMPNTSSKYAEEGTRAHELAEKLITDPEKVSIYKDDPEMIEAVFTYVEAFDEAKKGAEFWKVEQRFDLSNLHPGLFGTADGVIYHKKSKTLQVWDYKHGAGLAVEVKGNKQLRYYGLGALLALKVPCTKVELVIVQPRCYHADGPVRREVLDVMELMDFAADLIEAAKATEDPNAPIVPGDHCRFCPASPVCPALHDKAVTAAQSEFTPAAAYDPAHLSNTLDLLPAIEAWVKSVREFAYREAEAGKDIPNYKLVPKRATRKWKDKEQVERVLLTEFGLNYVEMNEEPKLKSPAQIEKMVGKEGKKRLEELVVKESSGSTLVPATDKREEVKPSVLTEFTVVEDQ